MTQQKDDPDDGGACATPRLDPTLVDLLPLNAAVDATGCLVLGGVSVAALAARFGTPLYVYDDGTIRAACRAYRDVFTTGRPGNRVHYASKAYLAPWLCRLLDEEGLDLDVVSGGEWFIAQAAGFPAARMRLHGNNKDAAELRMALDAGAGGIVVDNHDELGLLTSMAEAAGRRVPVLLRLSPGVEAHTHKYLQTGLLDSKFGLPIATGDALQALQCALAAAALDVRGYHMHVGTGLATCEAITEGVRRVVQFAQEARAQTGYWPREISAGGGLGIAYLRGERAPSVRAWGDAIARGLVGAEPRPAVSVEPGRSIVGRAGVALYTVGTRKRIAGVRDYVSVDGGMADNIRPALYQAGYTALAARRMNDRAVAPVTVAGRYCESGDILVRDAPLPALEPGDLLALAAAGAYCLPLSSQYNGALRPAVVVVRGGETRLVQRRGVFADLLTYDTLVRLADEAE